jgi:hypothetical protein
VGKSSPHFEAPDSTLEQQAGGLAFIPEAAATLNKTAPAING